MRNTHTWSGVLEKANTNRHDRIQSLLDQYVNATVSTNSVGIKKDPESLNSGPACVEPLPWSGGEAALQRTQNTTGCDEGQDLSLEAFLRLVVTTDKGWFYLAHSTGKPHWQYEWFSWPIDLARIVERVGEWAKTRNVYFCCHLFSEPTKLKELVLPSRTIHADLDDALLGQIPIPPTVLLQSSPARHQGFWVVDELLEPADLDQLSKNLTYAIPKCDHSGWEISHVMRVPGTYNHKRKRGDAPPPQVKVLERRAGYLSVQPFRALPHEPVVSGLVAQLPMPSGVATPELLKRAIEVLDARSVLRNFAELAEDRSKPLWSVIKTLLELGSTPAETFLVARESSNNKFNDERLWQDVQRAMEDNLDTPFKYTDSGIAKRFIADHGENLFLCKDVKPQLQWYWWRGDKWVVDHDMQRSRLLDKTLITLCGEALQMEPDLRRKAMGYVVAAASNVRKMGILNQARAHVQKKEFAELDSDPMLLNTPNGTIDLHAEPLAELLATGAVPPHRREDFITQETKAPYVHGERSPTMEKLVFEAMNKNEEDYRYLQQVSGICLTGDTSEAAMFILHGTGSNGKSKFVEGLAHVLGDYSRVTSRESLMPRHAGASTQDIARLRKARLVRCSELDSDRGLDESKIKSMVGDDTQIGRELYESDIEYKPLYKLIIYTNKPLEFKDAEYSMKRRLHSIPFKVTYLHPDERGAAEKVGRVDPETGNFIGGIMDLKLEDKLKAEAPGILNWMLEGCLAWQREGHLKRSTTVRSDSDAFHRRRDSVRTFLNECTEYDAQATITAENLFGWYAKFVTEEDLRNVGSNSFGKTLIQYGVERTRSNGHSVYHGRKLKAEWEYLQSATPTDGVNSGNGTISTSVEFPSV
jgi:putative DNA primase/helicase